MPDFYEKIASTRVAYITRDIERALGLGSDVPGMFIISNNTPFAKQEKTKANRTTIILIEETELQDTWQLLEHPATKDVMARENITQVMVFKPTPKIERICKAQGWTLINPSAVLANNIEEKISQVTWLENLTRFLPQHSILACKDVAWNFEPFVLQFNRAHTGNGTMLITSKEQLRGVQETFPERPVRTSAFISGPMFTSNNIVTPNTILTGNISYQITGMAPFTDNPFATVGNDWHIPQTILPYDAQSACKEIAYAVGKKLQQDGWRGAFGIDLIHEQSTGKMYLIEINARQPASVTFESQLQSRARSKTGANALTTAEAHTAALLDIDIAKATLVPITNGAQVIVRNGRVHADNMDMLITALTKRQLTTIPYPNTKPGTDLLRIQSTASFMDAHQRWSALGNDIADTIITSV